MKNGQSLSENEIIALLSRLKDSTPAYPAALSESRHAAFLQQTAGAKIVIGNKAILGKILHGMRATSSLVTKTVLLPLLSLTVLGTVLVIGDRLGWTQFIRDGLHIAETLVAPYFMPDVDESPTSLPLMVTPTPTLSPTPTATPTETLTPTLQTPTSSSSNSFPTPIGTRPGKRLGQTPTPPGHRDGNP